MKFRRKVFAVMNLVLLVGTIFSYSFASAQVGRDAYRDDTNYNTNRDSFYERSSYESDLRYRSSFNGLSDSSRYSSYYARPSFQTYYGSAVSTYWPQIGDAGTCEARQDLLLGVAPAGCQPAVVRSDLLAEQDVPVFCQIDSLKINPLINIDSIKNIRFGGSYPDEVVDVGFHPARAAIRTRDVLLGAPLVNNVGYAVVVLRRQPDESKLPDFVSVNLTAQIDYDSKNALGIGRSEFIVKPSLTEGEWERDKLGQSFWQGRYFLRLENVDNESADVSIYEGDVRIISERLRLKQTSRRIYMPGFYCQAGFEMVYDGLVSLKDRARIEVSTNGDSEIFDVQEGGRFLDNRCYIRELKINEDGTGTASLSCGGKKLELEIGQGGFSSLNAGGEQANIKKSGEEYLIDLNGISNESRRGVYVLGKDNELSVFRTNQELLIGKNGEFVNAPEDKSYREWIVGLWNSLKKYKQNPEQEFGLVDKEIPAEVRGYYDDAIKNYERVADDFPAEKELKLQEMPTYGERALAEAISLAEVLGQSRDKQRLINKFLQIYPNSNFVKGYIAELNYLESLDISKSVEVVEFDGKVRTVRLLKLIPADEDVGAVLDVEGKRLPLGLRETKNLSRAEVKHGEISLEELDTGGARLKFFCTNEEGNLLRTSNRTILREGQSQEICGLDVKVVSINAKQAAKIRILPASVSGTATETNFSVNVGIEKRAIKLNPDKTRDRIEEINKTIKKWEKISDSLGNVVSGMKTACFATSALLTFKNFMTGLSGETIARQDVMNGPNGWKNVCGDDDACYLQHAGEIDADVRAYTNALNEIQQKINDIQNREGVVTSSGLFGVSVDAGKVKSLLAGEARNNYGGAIVNTEGLQGGWGERKSMPLREILSEENAGAYGIEDIKSLMLYAELKSSGQLSEMQKDNVESKMKESAKRINDGVLAVRDLAQAKELERRGYPSAFEVSPSNVNRRAMHVVEASNSLKSEFGFSNDVSHIAMVRASISGEKIEGQSGEGGFSSGLYALGLDGDAQRGVYSIKQVSKKEGNLLSDEDARKFARVYGIGNIVDVGRENYRNEIVLQDRVVKYYETEPYRGMPAIVPFDTRNGWYAATRQTLPVFGGIGAFDASGRVVSFELCNVGKNGRIEVFLGYGDDLCQVINLNTGQPLGVYPGLSESEARGKVSDAIQAIQEAASQYGNQVVTINRERMKAEVTVGEAGTRCQDFMSPTDCHLLFNVCDPVICPSSRCDLGGTYKVANVVQTGIVGSIFLCLPNIKEGIVIPVCLTGIHAGVEAFTSILRNHRDCLQENLDTGSMVGICDQIYSIYLCEFFWRQIAPFVNILIPKLIEVAYGQGVRGGGEYLTVMGAWQNMENSINYFTQKYAVNSLKAFQARSSDRYGTYSGAFATGNIFELGGEFCKSWISTKAPKSFETLIEPDSPPQFYAWFDQIRYSDATVPATAQYKVFYHIFAGNDQGVHFSVYLKSPPEGGYYVSAPVLQTTPTKFIARGEYASETLDFTGPEGYKELCVRINNDEHCGFKQVSSDFAVNYLRDLYVNSELTKEGITTERECISGSPNAGALLQPNIQSGVEESAFPEVYNRGVVRICSTQNPGLTTNPARFVNVGYCDNQKVGCWLDTRSVDNALTSSNIGLRNATLQELESRAIDYLSSEGQILLGDDAKAEIDALERALVELDGKDRSSARTLLNRADEIFAKLLFNGDKARVLIIKARINEKVVLAWKAEQDKEEQGKRGIDEGVGPPAPEEITPRSGKDITWFEIANEGELDETVAALFTEEGENSFFGSGFLVPLKSEKIGVITAEHVIDVGGEILVATLEDDGTAVLLESSDSQDVAILETNLSLDSKVVEFDKGELKKGDEVFVLSFKSEFKEQTKKYLRVISEGAVSCDFTAGDPSDPVICEGEVVYFLEPKTTGDMIVYGDSGAPVFDLGENKVVAVVSAATFDEDGSSASDDNQIVTVIPINIAINMFEEHLISDYPSSDVNIGGGAGKACSITGVRWLNKGGVEILGEVEEGEVILSALGEGDCNGKEVRFSVYETDGIVKTLVRDKLTSTFEGAEARAKWTAVWEDDNILPWAEGNPDYYFNVWVVDEGGFKSSKVIEVTRRISVVQSEGGSDFIFALDDDELMYSVVQLYAQDASGGAVAGNGVLIPLEDGSIGILTAYHIIKDSYEGNKPIKLIISDREIDTFTKGDVLGISSDMNRKDLALIKTDLSLEDYRVVKVSSSQVNLGDNVFILTKGFVNGVPGEMRRQNTKVNNFANAPVNNIVVESGFVEGVSGSPVFNQNNELISVVYFSDTINGRNYLSSVPVSIARELFGDLIYGAQDGGDLQRGAEEIEYFIDIGEVPGVGGMHYRIIDSSNEFTGLFIVSASESTNQVYAVYDGVSRVWVGNIKYQNSCFVFTPHEEYEQRLNAINKIELKKILDSLNEKNLRMAESADPAAIQGFLIPPSENPGELPTCTPLSTQPFWENNRIKTFEFVIYKSNGSFVQAREFAWLDGNLNLKIEHNCDKVDVALYNQLLNVEPNKRVIATHSFDRGESGLVFVAESNRIGDYFEARAECKVLKFGEYDTIETKQDSVTFASIREY